MSKNILELLPDEIQDNIFEFVGYKEQFNEVLNELKMIFKVYKLLNHNNYIKNVIIHNYIIYDDD